MVDGDAQAKEGVAHHVEVASTTSTRRLGALWLACALAAPVLAWTGETRTGAVLAASIGLVLAERLRGRKVTSRVSAVLRVSAAGVTVDGGDARLLERGRIRAVVRAPAPEGAGERLLALDGSGNVAVDVIGPLGQIASIEESLAVARPMLPVRVGALQSAVSLALTILLVVASLWPGTLGRGADVLLTSIVGLWPLAAMLCVGSLTVGVDGLAFRSTLRRTEEFIPFRDVAKVEVIAEKLQVTMAAGVTRSWTFEYAGSAAIVERAWSAHVARREGRDETVVARRRVAVDDLVEAAPFRVRVEEPASLAEAILDSAEDASVRLRAARKLAAHTGDDAAAARDEAARRVADPAVRRELEGGAGTKNPERET